MDDGAALTVLIADDERPAREKVRRFVERDPEVRAVFEAADGPRALEIIREAEPDVVFLDIRMPGATGVEVLETLPRERAPHVVFVTAYDSYAVRAFDLSAVDYLLKPFDMERFEKAFSRAKAAVRSRERNGDLERLRRLVADWRTEEPRHLDRVAVVDGERTLLVTVRDVDRFEAEGNYVRVHVGRSAHRLRTTVSALERKLDPRAFARVGRGSIVNLDRVAELVPAGHGDYDIRLRDGQRVRLSRRYRDRLERFLPAGD